GGAERGDHVVDQDERAAFDEGTRDRLAPLIAFVWGRECRRRTPRDDVHDGEGEQRRARALLRFVEDAEWNTTGDQRPKKRRKERGHGVRAARGIGEREVPEQLGQQEVARARDISRGWLGRERRQDEAWRRRVDEMRDRVVALGHPE